MIRRRSRPPPRIASTASCASPAYARLKRDLAGGADDLIGVFEANETAATWTDVYPLIARLTRRDPATVKATAQALAPRP